jgi:hypothetical protein
MSHPGATGLATAPLDATAYIPLAQSALHHQHLARQVEVDDEEVAKRAEEDKATAAKEALLVLRDITAGKVVDEFVRLPLYPLCSVSLLPPSGSSTFTPKWLTSYTYTTPVCSAHRSKLTSSTYTLIALLALSAPLSLPVPPPLAPRPPRPHPLSPCPHHLLDHWPPFLTVLARVPDNVFRSCDWNTGFYSWDWGRKCGSVVSARERERTTCLQSPA